MENKNEGVFFEANLHEKIKEKFYFVDEDPSIGRRLFFENSGGSLRLKKSVEIKKLYDSFPDCSGRNHSRAKFLKKAEMQGIDDVMKVIFGAESGALITELTASQTMFQIVGTILENVGGTNAVTTALEHPSAYDAVQYYCDKTGKEFRSIPANKTNGGIDIKEVLEKVDEDTSLLSIMYASNVSGAIMNIEAIAKEVRKINPDIYIITDAVQHAPHGVIDVEKLKIDGINIAPYKFFGPRGSGLAYVSDRVAKLPHHRIIESPVNNWELGSTAASNYAAITEVVNYVCWLGGHYSNSTNRRELFINGMERIHLHERALLNRMLNGTANIPGLRNIPGVHVHVDSEDLTNKDLIVAMSIDGLTPTQCVDEYQKYGVTVFERINTDIFSKRIVEALGLEGVIRVSPLHCHSAKDIDVFLEITQKISKGIIK